VAIDGSKLRAVHAKGRHVTQATRAPALAPLADRGAAALQEWEATAAQDEAGTPGGARATARHPQIAALRARRLRYEALQAALQRRGHAQLARTAPASRSLQRGKGGGTAVC
jgi:hypothetical protein